ncbi:Autophagy protein 5 [Cytospora paraplurivora]|uniref:Autophagy protein 5 n=1 Tax=Cytospora paraplurivora TaxID=2898453 RepID=A0AAN9UNU1_9PEZI
MASSPSPSSPNLGQQQPSRPNVSIPQTLWDLRVPVFITHKAAPGLPFIASVPRFTYLAQLLPRLSAFFGVPCSSFHHEEVQLRNLAVGLLVDLYQPRLPWVLEVGDGDEWDIRDTFLNGVKEADFVRNGNSKQIMSLSKEHTTALWNAVQDTLRSSPVALGTPVPYQLHRGYRRVHSEGNMHVTTIAVLGRALSLMYIDDYTAFSKVNAHLLNPPTPLKHVPIRLYIPSSPPDAASGSAPGSFKTLGPALRSMLPSLFPSSRDPVLAQVILHGAPVPFSAPLEELMREAAYPDGWLCLIVVLL